MMFSAPQVSCYLVAALTLFSFSKPLMAVQPGDLGYLLSEDDEVAEEDEAGPAVQNMALDMGLNMRITTEVEEELNEELQPDEAEATPEEALFQYCNAASTPVPLIEAAVKACTDINRPLANFLQQTPMFPVCVRGNQEAAELLLAHGAKAAVQDEYGYTPLMACAERNFTTLMHSLFEHDGLLSLNDRERPISEDEADAFTYVPESAKFTNAAQNSALTYAARNGHQEACKLLIQMGAEVEVELADDTIPAPMREFIRREREAYLHGLAQNSSGSHKPACPCNKA